MCAMCLRVAVVVVVAVGCVTMNPLKQVPLQDACPSRNSCQQRDDTNFIDYPCQCDELCNTYADCCYDSKFRNASQQKTDKVTDFKCQWLGDEQVYVRINKCKAGWTDAEVEDLCTSGGVHTDPISRLPVTSNTTGYTYLNYYCAICNDDILGLRMWNSKARCDFPQHRDVDTDDLVFRNDSWGVLLGSPKSPDFRPCYLFMDMPEDIRNLTRRCSESIRTCTVNWQDEVVASLCQSYTAEIYYDGNVAYRNPHCALCNGRDGNYYCYSAEINVSHRFPSPAYGMPVSFTLLFDFADSRNNLVGSSSPCNATQVWDPFFKRCRSIVCPKPNQDYRYGRCVALSDVNSMEGNEPTDVPTTTAATTATDGAAATTTNNGSNSSNITSSNSGGNAINNDSNSTNSSNSHSSSSNSTTTDTTASVTNNNSTTVTNSNNNTTSDTLLSTEPPPTSAPETEPTTIQSNGTFPEDKHPIVFPEEPTEPPTTPSEERETPTSPPHSTPPPDASTPVSPPPSTPPPDASTPVLPPTLLPGTDSTPADDAALSTNTSSEFSECYKVILVEGEFAALPNGTVYVEEYDRTYSPGEYARISEGLLVCLPDIASSSRKFSAALGWVSLAGLGLSCTSLLLHLAAFTLLPELRNLSGRNLASLCLALFAAYITFLVNMLVRPDPAGCVTLAAAMYYFFVTSFTWMNVIAFDVWYTFHQTQRQLRVSNGDQWHRFIAYSLYSWLLPAAATLALLLVDQLEPHGVPEEFLPRLGRTWCWFSHRKALLAFFAAPMVVIIVVNCVLFVSTAVIITQSGSTAAAVSARGNHPRGQYRMYLRLAVLMGFTWVSGIAAAYLDMEALWYVFVLLNTLQGVFIFLAFTFRTRVWQGVGATCRKLLQRGLSKMTRRSPPADIRAFELSHTPEGTCASYSSSNTNLEAF